MRPSWPEAAYEKGVKVADSRSYSGAERGSRRPTEEGVSRLRTSIAGLLIDLTVVDVELAADLDAKHGAGSADSKRFRSLMAEYCRFLRPISTRCATREKKGALSDWLSSPAGFLAFTQVFVLSGSGGAGKTHSLCDIAERRLADAAFTCVVFGHQFGGDRSVDSIR